MGLRSVSMTKDSRPTKYLSNFSHALTEARHSFSVCAYCSSALLSVLELNATGR